MPEFLGQVRLDELEIEFRSADRVVLAAGLRPTHLDWHSLRISSRRPDIFDVVFRLALEYGLALRVSARSFIDKLQSQGFPTTTTTFWTATSLIRPRKRLVMLNCCASARWFERVGGASGPRHPELSALEPGGDHIRQADYDFLTSQEAKDLVREEGIILLDYRRSRRFGKNNELKGKYPMHIQSLTGAWQFRQAGTEGGCPPPSPAAHIPTCWPWAASPTHLWATTSVACSGWPRPIGSIAVSLPSRPSCCASRTSGWSATGWTRWRP